MTTQHRDAWDAVMKIVEKLRARGHKALLVGGCVRDRLLDQIPKDYDVATDAQPTKIKAIFPRAREVGAQFGVMLVRQFGHDIEVATFRTDGLYSDGRHPDRVTFGTDIEDAKRRDFTINGLFQDPRTGQIIDYVGGLCDLNARIIRTIGDAATRFTEDHLRLLRAVRFTTRLGFSLESETYDAIRRLASNLESISPERIWLELQAMLCDPARATAWSLLVETGLRSHLVAEWAPREREDSRICGRLGLLPDRPVDPSLALAACVSERTPEETGYICTSLRLSNKLSKAVVWLVASLPSLRLADDLELPDLKILMSNDDWPNLLELFRADLVATGADVQPFDRISNRAADIPREKIAPTPFLTGNDLCKLGVEPGPRMGVVLNAVYRAQLAEMITARDEAISFVHNFANTDR